MATVADVYGILEIYKYYVKNTTLTFEYEVPSEEEVKELRKEGKVKPILEQRITDREPLSFKFTANATYLITVS